MARTIEDVARRLADVVPEEQAGRFEATISSSYYTAPEAMAGVWRELSSIVNDIVGPPPLRHDWQISAVAILTESSEDDVRAAFGVPSEE